MTIYPIGIDSSLTLPQAVDAVTGVNAQTINQLREAILSIETELGVKPSSTYGTVRARLDALEAGLQTLTDGLNDLIEVVNNLPSGGGGGGGSFTPGGDLGGNGTSQIVIRLQGKPISSTAPTLGQYLAWDATAWTPTTPSVQAGFNYSKFFDVMAFPNEPSTNQHVFVNGGSFEFNPNNYTAANGTRTMKLKIISETTGPLMTIQLYNLTTNSIVPGTIMTTSSITAMAQMTADLTPVLYNGTAVYQVQIKMGDGGTTDRVTLVYAVLRVEWS